MSRAKDFVVDEVLDKALAVFHKQGYSATSMQDLVDAMGINRFSVYASFGSKDGLFLAALKRYLQWDGAQFLRVASHACSAKEAIVEILNLTVTLISEDKERKGCFLVNSAIELSALPYGAANDVMRGMGATQELLEILVQRAQQEKDISPEHDSRHLAAALLAGIIGMRVLGRAGTEIGTLQMVAQGHIKSLN
jgi:TetR/AcrR family transcriptional regulator, transcriptional repressor for nem operon